LAIRASGVIVACAAAGEAQTAVSRIRTTEGATFNFLEPIMTVLALSTDLA